MLIEVVGVFLLGMCTLILIAAVENVYDTENQMNEESEEDNDGKRD